MYYSMGFEDEEETTVSASVGTSLMQPCLEVVESRDTSLVGRIFPIGEGLSIGRRDEADLRLLDRSVSRDSKVELKMFAASSQTSSFPFTARVCQRCSSTAARTKSSANAKHWKIWWRWSVNAFPHT